MEVQNEFSSNVVWFVRVDCNLLKETLINHCVQFQNKLTGLLNQNGYQELKDIFDLFQKSKDNLSSQPLNLEDLSAKISLSRELKEQLQSLQRRFQPIRDIYVGNRYIQFKSLLRLGHPREIRHFDKGR